MLVGKWKCTVGKVGSRLGLARPALTFVVFDFFQLLTLPPTLGTYKVLSRLLYSKNNTVTTSDEDMLLPALQRAGKRAKTSSNGIYRRKKKKSGQSSSVIRHSHSHLSSRVK